MNQKTNQANDAWLQSLAPSNPVWWNDPEFGISSGYYSIVAIQSDGFVEEDTIVVLANDDGSEAEVFAFELTPKQPDDLFPFVDCENGQGVILGYACNKDEAITLGSSVLLKEIEDVKLATNLQLQDGTVLSKAWVAVNPVPSEIADLRVVLNVTYSLNRENATEMAGRLQRMCEYCIGEGMLTGESDAEVENFSIDVSIQSPATAHASRPSVNTASPDDLKTIFGEEHPEWPMLDWKYEVANNDSTLGYWAWVQNKLELEG